MMLAGYTLRELGRHRARTLLTLTGVIIGVGALVAVGVTLDTTRGAYRDLLRNAGGRASLEVRADGVGGLDPALLSKVAGTPGVQAAVGSARGSAALVTDDGPQPSLPRPGHRSGSRQRRAFPGTSERQAAPYT
ncbi:MAG: hypothetical protein ACYSX0_03825 [Planctomycetota bacterium]|jgi:hypothetical protein